MAGMARVALPGKVEQQEGVSLLPHLPQVFWWIQRPFLDGLHQRIV